MANNNLFGRIDWWLTFLVFALTATGLIAVYSATSTADSHDLFYRQLTFAVIGFIMMVIIAFIPFKLLQKFAYPFYGLAILLLVFVEFFGVKGFGAERWLDIGVFKIQPSEIAKLATIMAIARYLSGREVNINRPKHFLIVSAFIALPFLLIIKQPDLGTSLVYMVLFVPLLFWAGLNIMALFLIISPVLTLFFSFNLYLLIIWLGIIVFILYKTRRKLIYIMLVLILHIGIGASTPYMWDQLQPYQKKRITTFLNPEADPRGSGYQIIQSQVAVGSGSVWGKGFMNGTQTQLRFLPAQHTDFIFSVWAEEWGFAGVIFVLTLFFLLIFHIVNKASNLRATFSSTILIGIATILMFHIFINIGMTIGMAPVTGLPLPFISYGGSFLLSTLLMMGVVQNLVYNKFLS